jgi:predicted secreted protein
MANLSGKMVVVKWAKNTGTPTPAAFACETNATLSVTQNTTTVSCKSIAAGGWESAIPTTKSWEVTCDCLYQDDDVATGGEFVDLMDLYITGANEVEVSISDAHNAWSGVAICTSLSLNAPDGDSATYSATFTGKGPLTYKLTP